MDGKKPTNVVDKLMEEEFNKKNDTVIQKFEVEEKRPSIKNTRDYFQTNRNQVSSHPREEDFFDKVKRIYTEVSTNRNVRAVFCPFDDSSSECQVCYKICVGITLLILLFVFYLISKYN